MSNNKGKRKQDYYPPASEGYSQGYYSDPAHNQYGAQYGHPAPTGPPLNPTMVPSLQVPHAMQHELNGDTIHRALKIWAGYLYHHKQHITIVTVGGAVNTLYLGTRKSTHDVDFIASEDANSWLDAGSKVAQQDSASALGRYWINNQTAVFIPNNQLGYIIDQAKAQNVKVFEQPGLTVYAAPWLFAFVGKTDRISKGNPRDYDVSDAVAYLHEYIRSNGQQPVSKGDIFKWADYYGRGVTTSILQQINAAYFATYKTYGIVN